MNDKMPSSPEPAKLDCFECGGTVEVAFWDDAVLSGALKVHCPKCNSERPEKNLWDLQILRNNDFLLETKENVSIPNFEQDLAPDLSEVIIVDSHEKLEMNLDEEMLDHIEEIPQGEKYEIFVEDAENKDLVEKAREKLREIKD